MNFDNLDNFQSYHEKYARTSNKHNVISNLVADIKKLIREHGDKLSNNVKESVKIALTLGTCGAAYFLNTDYMWSACYTSLYDSRELVLQSLNYISDKLSHNPSNQLRGSSNPNSKDNLFLEDIKHDAEKITTQTEFMQTYFNYVKTSKNLPNPEIFANQIRQHRQHEINYDYEKKPSTLMNSFSRQDRNELPHLNSYRN